MSDTEAVESIEGDSPALFVSCEHASEAFPFDYRLPDEDKWIEGTHWAFDLGARDLTFDIAKATRAPAVLSRFSRLLADPNRPPDSPTLFREVAEGRTLALNRDLTEAGKERRLTQLYRPYHERFDTMLQGSTAQLVLAVHSFTPLYEGQPRSLEIGVLFEEEDAMATALAAEYKKEGFEVRLNEPYAGAEFMYAAHSHAQKLKKKALEIEVRQDLCVKPAERRRVADATARFVMKFLS